MSWFNYVFRYSRIGRRQRRQFWDRLNGYPIKLGTPWDNYLQLIAYYPEDTPIWNGRYWEDSCEECYDED
jgi:hypothetical protein